MPQAVTHPSAQVLAAFVRGQLSPAAAASVAGHLAGCPACRKAVQIVPESSAQSRGRDTKAEGSTRVGGPAPARGESRPRAPEADPASVPGLPPELAAHAKYRVVRELGRGGMGVVYQAVQTLMDRPVALKVINPAVLAHPDALPRFHAEVRAAARLDHPHIVRAHDAEQVGNLHLLVMEFVEGQSLADLVSRKGPLPVPHACHYVRQVALGLQHAFEKGMVHRDIKPHNLMVSPHGVVKILDFGLARLRNERSEKCGLTAAGAFMGTPEYVAPEQATDARTADTRADLYSLGCTLYFALTGRPPFVEDTDIKLVLAHIEKQPPALNLLRPDVPAELAAVASRLLAKDPAARYQTPLEVAEALAPFCKPANPEAAPTPAPPPLEAVSPNTATSLGKTPAASRPARKWSPRDETWENPPPVRTLPAPVLEEVAEVRGVVPVAQLVDVGDRGRRPAGPWYLRWPILAGAGAVVLGLSLVVFLLARPAKVRPAPEPPPAVAVRAESPQEVTVLKPRQPEETTPPAPPAPGPAREPEAPPPPPEVAPPPPEVPTPPPPPEVKPLEPAPKKEMKTPNSRPGTPRREPAMKPTPPPSGSAPAEKTAPQDRKEGQSKGPTDAFQPGTVWEGTGEQWWHDSALKKPVKYHVVLTVLSRDGNAFTATLEEGDGSSRRIRGTLENRVLKTSVRDDVVIKGKKGLDLSGKMISDKTIEADWSGFDSDGNPTNAQCRLRRK